MSANGSFITVVSGLPRSGTSLMMQMLHAGGIDPLTDGVREPDEDNPRGYFEYEAARMLRSDASWLGRAVGKSVKVVHLLLPALPPHFQYRVILMYRSPEDVLASQLRMLRRRGGPPAAIPPGRMLAVYAAQLRQVEQWISAQPNCRMMTMEFEALFESPEGQARRVAAFCGGSLDVAAMARTIDPALRRTRLVEARRDDVVAAS